MCAPAFGADTQVCPYPYTQRKIALEAFPQAKAAFLRAAATWESLIQTPITIIIDVDFGPTSFGEPFRENVLGSTDFQLVGSNNLYSAVRQRLLANASSAQEVALYNSLPAVTVPTDLGTTTYIAAPAALFRALGILNAVADPDRETAQGPPPSIGFNSNFAFDFDASDGIDNDKSDFEAMALHEIGHALGFYSRVGLRELDPSLPPEVSIWDLFRFRPGATPGSFGSASRILSSGGEHRFFAGGTELALSTGRPNSTGGDERQPHHWKDDFFTGQQRLGIMDPSSNRGDHDVITENDLIALDAMGYQINRGGPPPPPGDGVPTIQQLSADLDANVLTLTVTATDADGDIAQAQSKLLDGAGQIVGQTDPFPINVGTATTATFGIQITNMGEFPTALKTALALIDRSGSVSEEVTADFSQADPGGPTLSAASFRGTKLKIKGSDLNGQVEVESNGRIVAAGFNGSNKKVKIR